MGWTHSWSRPTELSADLFRDASRDCSAIVSKISVPLAGFDGTGAPTFSEDKIIFNGLAPRTCEPFEIHQTEFDRCGRQLTWSFCKTERLPYDLCVQTALIVLKHHLTEAISVQSDGADDDWRQARQICQRYLGYGELFQLTKLENA